MERMYTEEEFLKLVGVTRGTLNNWCYQGKISYRRISGKKRVFMQSDIDEFLERSKKSAV
jgi:excisionase family DNA binding protein